MKRLHLLISMNWGFIILTLFIMFSCVLQGEVPTQTTDSSTNATTFTQSPFSSSGTMPPTSLCEAVMGYYQSYESYYNPNMNPADPDCCYENWELEFSLSTFNWKRMGVTVYGTYTCEAGALQGESPQEPGIIYVGEMDETGLSLTWNGILYIK